MLNAILNVYRGTYKALKHPFSDIRMVKKPRCEGSVLLYIAIAAMLVLIYAISFVSFGSILQKTLLVAGAFVLFVVATLGNQKVLQALQLVIVAGALLGFLQLQPIYSLAVMLIVAVLMVAYLFSIEHYKKEPVGAIGSFGFVLLAIGLAFNTGSNPLITGAALGFGALAIAVYSSASFFLYRIRLQIVWVALNIVFAISPLVLFVSNA